MKPPLRTALRRQSAGVIFRVPAVIAAITVAGLMSALLGDGVWDVASWLTLSVPVAAVAWFALGR